MIEELSKKSQIIFLKEQLQYFFDDPIHDQIIKFQARLMSGGDVEISNDDFVKYINNLIKNEALLSQLKESSWIAAKFDDRSLKLNVIINKHHIRAKRTTDDVICYFTEKGGDNKSLLPYDL